MLEEVEQSVVSVDVRDSGDIEYTTVQEVEQEQVEFEMPGDDMTEEEREVIMSITDRKKEGNLNVPMGFKKIESSKLDQETKKVNKVIGFILAATIADTNRLIGAVATYVGPESGSDG